MIFLKKQNTGQRTDQWLPRLKGDEKCSYKGVPQGSFGAAETVPNPDFGHGYTNQSILVMMKATQDQK